MEWATKRKLMIAMGLMSIVMIIFLAIYFSRFYQAPSCTDQKQNQDETGIDCGGSCPVACPEAVPKPLVLWSRSFNVVKGVYNAVAYVENPNANLGVKDAVYRFYLYDDNNVLIAEREGRIFLTPNEKFAIFEPRILTGERTVRRTFFEFVSYSNWIKIKEQKLPILVRNSKSAMTETSARVDTALENPTLIDIRDINVVALVYDASDNAIQASATQVNNLPAQSSQNLTFTWPQPFPASPARIEVIPRVNALAE